MARTYTDIPEPRKVLEADTIRGYSRETVEEALAGVPIKLIHINIPDNSVSEDYDTFMSYFEMYDEGKCILMVDGGGDGIVPVITNWESPGCFWLQLNPATGVLIIQSVNFVVDSEGKTVSITHFVATYTGTIES